MDNQIATNPAYMIVDDLGGKELLDMLDLLSEVLAEIKAHPKLPYPFFIISRANVKHKDFHIVSSKETITNYYRLKIKKLKKRELNLLNKVNMIVERIHNYPLNEYLEQMKSDSYYHKVLRDLCVEKAFYKEQLQKMNQQEADDE